MSFLHPWALYVGAGALFLPVAVHLLTRPRPVRLPLSTVRFVRAALRQRRARSRLRDAVVLGLRCLAVLLLALALARPLSEHRPLVNPDAPGTAARVVLLDVSRSNAAGSRGVRVFERARSAAASYLGEQAGLRANLLLAGAVPRPAFEQLTVNLGALREEVSRAQPRPERLNVQAALNRAGELLASAPGRRELVVVSDFQRTNWAAADFTPLPEDTLVELRSVAPDEPLPNLAILRVAGPGRAEQGRDVRVEVEVGNYSPAARTVRVEVAAGESVARAEGVCPPGRATTLTAELPPRGSGWQAGTARIVDAQDALPEDDSRPFVLDVRPPPVFALVTRQPASAKGASYYLERALAPLTPRPGRAGPSVRRLAPARLEREGLGDADLLVIDHPGRLPAPATRLLATLLRRGRGVLYVAAEADDAVNLKALADAAGAGLQMPVEFVPPPAGQRRRGLFLTNVRRDQSPFSALGDSLDPLTGPLRFAGGLATHRVEDTLAEEVLAAYGDGSACLVVTPCGAGTLAVLNADLGGSDLPASPAFVPLVGELADRLLVRAHSAGSVACGEPVAVPLPPDAGPLSGLTLRGPDGAAPGLLGEEGDGVVWRWDGDGPPGVFEVRRGAATVFAHAAATPAEESDLRGLEPDLLVGRLAGARKVRYTGAGDTDEGTDRNWAWLAAGCVLCLLGELVALKLFRT